MSRLLTKDISVSKKFASLSTQGQILFLMMVPHLSAYGKMPGSPEYVKGVICPRLTWATVPVISKCLLEISEKTNVKWFEHDGLYFIHSLNFQQHQPGLSKTKYREDQYPDYSCDTPKDFSEDIAEDARRTRGEGAEDTQNPLDLESNLNLKSKSKSNLNKESASLEAMTLFTMFWEVYPKKVKKQKAQEAWNRIDPDEILAQTIIDHVVLARNSHEWRKREGQFIPHPSVYLNNRRWEDEMEELPPVQEVSKSRTRQTMNNIDNLVKRLDQSVNTKDVALLENGKQ